MGKNTGLHVCYWVEPDGTEHRAAIENYHSALLRESGFSASHSNAFEVGFLRLTVLEPSFSAQWQGTLTSAQRAACVRLAENCSFIEISGAVEGFDPEGKVSNFSLVREDSKFLRLFAACLRRRMDEW